MVQLEECSEVYRRYEGLEGIDAAYIKNYRVNDTLTLPVTLLCAKRVLHESTISARIKIFFISSILG